jgi:hypothetical protein
MLLSVAYTGHVLIKNTIRQTRKSPEINKNYEIKKLHADACSNVSNELLRVSNKNTRE